MMERETDSREGKVGDSDTPKEQKYLSVFTSEEVRDIVKGFISSYIEGTISISFPTAPMLVEQSKLTKENLSYKVALDKEIDIKRKFNELLALCSGCKSCNPDELKEGISALFILILHARSGGNIKGNFVKYSTEERLNKLEQGQNLTNDLIEQLIDWIKSGGALP